MTKAELKILDEKVKDMMVAHSMSHEPFCDSAYWRDEHRRLAKEVKEILEAHAA